MLHSKWTDLSLIAALVAAITVPASQAGAQDMMSYDAWAVSKTDGFLVSKSLETTQTMIEVKPLLEPAGELAKLGPFCSAYIDADGGLGVEIEGTLGAGEGGREIVYAVDLETLECTIESDVPAETDSMEYPPGEAKVTTVSTSPLLLLLSGAAALLGIEEVVPPEDVDIQGASELDGDNIGAATLSNATIAAKQPPHKFGFGGVVLQTLDPPMALGIVDDVLARTEVTMRWYRFDDGTVDLAFAYYEWIAARPSKLFTNWFIALAQRGPLWFLGGRTKVCTSAEGRYYNDDFPGNNGQRVHAAHDIEICGRSDGAFDYYVAHVTRGSLSNVYLELAKKYPGALLLDSSRLLSRRVIVYGSGVASSTSLKLGK